MKAKRKHTHRRPTLQAIADRAGVSRTTASMILGNRQDVDRRFAPATIDRVRRVAEAMGYRANLVAMSLRMAQPAFFGLVLRGPGTLDARSWHYWAFEGLLLTSVTEESRRLDLYPVLAMQDSQDVPGAIQRIETILHGGVCGAILRTPVPALADVTHTHIARGLCIVVVFPEDTRVYPTNAICVDSVTTGRLAGQLLIDMGRCRWLVLCDALLWEDIQLREQGALDIARESGAQAEMLAMPPGLSEDEALKWLVPRLKDRRPDAVYATSSATSVAALLACREVGLRAPDDTCVVGCDASLWRAPGYPTVTTVDVSWEAVGQAAVQKIAEMRVKGESVFENFTIPPLIRPGESCPVRRDA